MKATYFLFFLALVLIFSCEKTESLKTELTGTWIDLPDKLDTIVFQNGRDVDLFVVKNGYEIRNGYWLPKLSSGMYQYKFNTDSIFVNNMFWNCVCYQQYYFKVNSSMDTFQIGNFIHTDKSDTELITFFKSK